MKKFIGIICAWLLISTAYAYEPAIYESVSNSDELNCKETIFISGEPVTLTGTLSISGSGKEASAKETYEYSLSDENGNSVSRELTFAVTSNEKANKQVSKVWKLEEFSESIVVGDKTYTLDKYDFSKTRLDEVRPVGTYFAGNINLAKEYSYDGGTVKVLGSGSIYGYDTAWAKNETVSMTYTVSNKPEGGYSWSGKYKTTTSQTDQKKVTYIQNRPTEISFDGGYMLAETNLFTLRYSYEMPEVYNGKVLDYLVKDEGSYKFESFPIEERLPNYLLKGIKGHWGEMALRQAFALEYMDEWDANDTPNTAVTRGEFAKIMALALKLDLEKKTEGETFSYKDVQESNPYYPYIMALTREGVVEGTGNSRFQPNAVISRAEAITMMINALGFQDRAPEPLPLLQFNDATAIPKWAEKFIYMADKIGLIHGDENGNSMATKHLTKAEIATMTNNMVRYLIEDLGEEYIL